jgi:alpha-tubulin suppressor-like RCC1 family protein
MNRALGVLLALAIAPLVSTPARALPPLTGVLQVSAGGNHTCAIAAGGGVQCWGFNAQGQLGDATTGNRPAPVGVSGLASGMSSVQAAFLHTCALTTGGGVKCWGRNTSGQLGDTTTANRSAPVDVSGLATGATAIAAGLNHSCAVTTGGGLKCWGYNYYGQLGDDSNTLAQTPVNVFGLASGIAAVRAGSDHTCALTTGGGVKCWGRNRFGQLGDGSTTERHAPADVSGFTSGATAIAVGFDHSCALTAGGGVNCWGFNGWGQLGDGSITSRSTPGGVSGLASGVVSIAAGQAHTCALTTGGGVKCWGDNSSGQLGDNSTTYRVTPVNVLGLASGVMAIAAGEYHTCALTTGGGVKCWGYNALGQLGDATTVSRPFPAAVLVADTTPDAFGFIAQPNVTAKTTLTSNTITPSGFDAPLAISVSGGLYAIGCGAFTSSPGTISPGQSVCVRHVASPTVGASVTTTLTIGGDSGTFTSTTTMPVPRVPYTRGDTSGDGKADLFWREAAPGTGLSWWAMNGNAVSASNYFQVDSSWQIADVGDFDNDGKSDLIWRRASDGATYLWTLDGMGIKGFFDLGVLSAATWTLVGAGDLNDDGTSDLVWRSNSGLIYFWLMEGGAIVAQGGPPNALGAEWIVVDLVDMDGDGKADIVFRNANTGLVYVWFMNGMTIASQSGIGTLDPATWTLVGAADFDGDGKGDLLWRHYLGDIWVWKMNGAAFVSAALVGNPGPGWSIRSLADLDGDGKVDLVLQHTNGAINFWKMNGAAVTSLQPIANPGGTWHIVAP